MTIHIVLRGGTILQHDEQDNIIILKNTDILIEGNQITRIGQHLDVDQDATNIDCHGKIVAPGFINAHHHMWQSQLKGRLGDSTMLDYIIEANLQSINFTPEDIYWGQLGGCLEALDGGTTCVIDNAHMSTGPAHGSAALEATITSGIRAIFCYGVMPLRGAEWTTDSFELGRDPQPDWLLTQMKEFAGRAPFGEDGRVQLGYFFDSYFLPNTAITKTLGFVKQLGVKLVSSHFRHWPISKGQSQIPEKLKACGLLGQEILLAHGNGLTSDQADLLTSSGTYVVSTPDSEIFMASGADPVAFREDLPLTCLGADCHSCGPASMLHQMQIALASNRGVQTSAMFAADQYPKRLMATVQKAFNMATIQAARAARMDDQIGSIAVGKLADLVVFDTSTPSMSCAAEHDPLTALVRHAGTREVEMVIVGGRICKQGGKLRSVQRRGAEFDQFTRPIQDLSWYIVSRRLSESRRHIQERISKVDKDLARMKLLEVMGGLAGVLVE